MPMMTEQQQQKARTMIRAALSKAGYSDLIEDAVRLARLTTDGKNVMLSLGPTNEVAIDDQGGLDRWIAQARERRRQMKTAADIDASMPDDAEMRRRLNLQFGGVPRDRHTEKQNEHLRAELAVTQKLLDAAAERKDKP